jgi:hypothetical protein
MARIDRGQAGIDASTVLTIVEGDTDLQQNTFCDPGVSTNQINQSNQSINKWWLGRLIFVSPSGTFLSSTHMRSTHRFVSLDLLCAYYYYYYSCRKVESRIH